MGWDDRAAADASGRGLGVEPEANSQTELISTEPEIAFFFFNFYFVSKVQFEKIYINTNSVQKNPYHTFISLASRRSYLHYPMVKW